MARQGFKTVPSHPCKEAVCSDLMAIFHGQMCVKRNDVHNIVIKKNTFVHWVACFLKDAGVQKKRTSQEVSQNKWIDKKNTCFKKSDRNCCIKETGILITVMIILSIIQKRKNKHLKMG